MSRKPSKFRKAKRAQRDKRKPITVDFETRGLPSIDLGTRVHRALFNGDTHFAEHGQIMAYAIPEIVVVQGGDIIHGDKR